LICQSIDIVFNKQLTNSIGIRSSKLNQHFN
jgi:hypothetical protein